jgi:hypothetical protein
MKKSVQRVVMSREVATNWLRKKGHSEYRLKIFGSRIRNFPGLLRSFRDMHIRIAGVLPLPDLGIQEDFDSITVWSANHAALKSLQKWAEVRGMETSGIW